MPQKRKVTSFSDAFLVDTAVDTISVDTNKSADNYARAYCTALRSSLRSSSLRLTTTRARIALSVRTLLRTLSLRTSESALSCIFLLKSEV